MSQLSGAMIAVFMGIFGLTLSFIFFRKAFIEGEKDVEYSMVVFILGMFVFGCLFLYQGLKLTIEILY
ncbi:hypothetical protein D6833_01810 [Candidatus Parcubacteria bacterium]|nr:MAG: hypothetical protein D6833_01810 [Candidatus Parcubacteria bacterium]